MMSNLLLMKPEFVFVLWICAGKYKRKPTRKCRKGSGLALPNRLRTLSVPPEVPEWPAGLLSVQKPLNKSAQNNRVHQKLPARLCRAPFIIIRRDLLVRNKVVRYMSGDSYFVKHVACSPYLQIHLFLRNDSGDSTMCSHIGTTPAVVIYLQLQR